jgi:hypothetical protein
VKYDDGAYHLGSAATPEHAVAHIGLYFRWCVVSGLVSDEHTDDPDLERMLRRVRKGSLPGGSYLWENTSGKLAECDLTQEGNDFTRAMYSDYCARVASTVGREQYQFTEAEVDFATVQQWLDGELQKWRSTPRSRPWWRFW